MKEDTSVRAINLPVSKLYWYETVHHHGVGNGRFQRAATSISDVRIAIGQFDRRTPFYACRKGCDLFGSLPWTMMH